jgi:DNA-binding MarR family transcriptional regulator
MTSARKVIDLRETDRARILATFGHGGASALLVLETLFRSPITSVSGVRELTGLSRPAANQLVTRLEELGILIEITGQRRNRYFRYDAYVRLFDDPVI